MSRRGPDLAAALQLALLLAALPLAGCYSTGIKQLGERSAIVTGTVSTRERIALPAESLVVVELVDPTGDDEFPLIIAQQTITPQTQAPTPFTLEFSPALIDPNHDYAVRARVVSSAGVLFHTVDPPLVVTYRRPYHADLLLVSGEIETTPPAATEATPMTTP